LWLKFLLGDIIEIDHIKLNLNATVIELEI